jgi:hypothetical protein
MKNKSGIAFGLLLVLAVGLMVAYVTEFQDVEDNTLEAETTSESATSDTKDATSKEEVEKKLEQDIERTKHLQSERKRIMDEMVDGGIAERIENPAGKPFVYVLDPFYGLSFDEQAALMNVIWSYYITEDRNSNVLTIYDAKTGTEIGTYTQAGLKMEG